MRVGSICVYAVLTWQMSAAAPPSVAGRVVDENGVAVASARVEVSSGGTTVTATTDSAGNFTLEVLSPGQYEVRAERLGFFIYSGKSVALEEGANHLTITLNHLQELTESVEVKYSPPRCPSLCAACSRSASVMAATIDESIVDNVSTARATDA